MVYKLRINKTFVFKKKAYLAFKTHLLIQMGSG